MDTMDATQEFIDWLKFDLDRKFDMSVPDSADGEVGCALVEFGKYKGLTVCAAGFASVMDREGTVYRVKGFSAGSWNFPLKPDGSRVYTAREVLRYGFEDPIEA